jgi:hypothetical protein
MTITIPDDWWIERERIWQTYGGVDLTQYPPCCTPDSGAGETCRLLAGGASLRDATVACGVPWPVPPDLIQGDLVTVGLLRMAAIHATELHDIGVATPGVTAHEAAWTVTATGQVLDVLYRCGRPTRSGRPCRNGQPCHVHPTEGTA